jgi:hypothetical protein
MTQPFSPLSSDLWLRELFSSKSARDGQVIRRKARDIERYAGKFAFEAEIKRRGYRAYENGGQILIICNQDPVRRIV